MAVLPAVVSCNGVFISPADAQVSVFNPALYGAFGVYESLQVANGQIFELVGHLNRLAHSAAVIELRLPAPPEQIAGWVADVVTASGQAACTVRLFVVSNDDNSAANAYIWTQPPTHYPLAYYQEGVAAITFAAQRFLPESKSLNALSSFMAQRRARAAGVHEALLQHAGCLTEGSNSNLFAVIGGEVVTPPDAEVLAGVTREVVLRLAREHEIPVHCAALPLAGRADWQESFITSTSRHVMPLIRVDDATIGDGRPGPVTRRLHALFEAYFAAQVGA